MTALHPEFAPVAIIACLSLLLPLPWHWRARNVATLAMIFWLFVSNFTFAVDALVWGDSIRKVIPVWCDITTKFIIGANFALPAACLCISMHLERVASLRSAQSSIADQRRRRWLEAAMCFGLPLGFMGLHFIVQGHRFDIIEGYGCRPSTYFSIPSIFIIWVPPMVMAVGSLVFSAIALRHFVMRRLTFAAHLNSTKSALTTSRYLRLMAMAAMQMIWTITASGYAFWFSATFVPIRPWTNWDDVHSDFGRIDQFPDFFTPKPIRQAFYVLWWMVPISTFLFVAFFAFGNDAVEEYKKCFAWVRVNIFRMEPSSNSTKKPFSFVTFSNSKTPVSLPISKPTLQSTTSSSDSTLSPQRTRTSRLSAASSMHKSVTTIFTETDDTHHDLNPYHLKYPKAIGSYSDLSIVDPTSPLSPSTTVASLSAADIERGWCPDFPPSPPAPLSPPPPHPRRLRPLFLANQDRGRDAFANGMRSPTSRPLSYPSYSPPHLTVNPPLPTPSRPPMPLSNQ